MDSFLSAVGAFILTAPIHYRGSISESKWCSFSKSDEEIHPSTSWITWGWVHFQHIFIFWINFPLKDLIPKKTFKSEVTEEKRSCSIWDMQIRTLDINKCGFSPVFFKAAACSFQLSIKTAIIHRSPRELWPWRETHRFAHLWQHSDALIFLSRILLKHIMIAFIFKTKQCDGTWDQTSIMTKSSLINQPNLFNKEACFIIKDLYDFGLSHLLTFNSAKCIQLNTTFSCAVRFAHNL